MTNEAIKENALLLQRLDASTAALVVAEARLTKLVTVTGDMMRHQHPHRGSCVTYGLVDGRSMVTRESCKCAPELKDVREVIAQIEHDAMASVSGDRAPAHGPGPWDACPHYPGSELQRRSCGCWDWPANKTSTGGESHKPVESPEASGPMGSEGVHSPTVSTRPNTGTASAGNVRSRPGEFSPAPGHSGESRPSSAEDTESLSGSPVRTEEGARVHEQRPETALPPEICAVITAAERLAEEVWSDNRTDEEQEELCRAVQAMRAAETGGEVKL